MYAVRFGDEAVEPAVVPGAAATAAGFTDDGAAGAFAAAAALGAFAGTAGGAASEADGFCVSHAKTVVSSPPATVGIVAVASSSAGTAGWLGGAGRAGMTTDSAPGAGRDGKLASVSGFGG